MTVEAAPAPPATRSAGHAFSYLPALDGLRGLSVVAVLFFHAGHLRGGFLGVDLFFALSGFLITTLLIREVETSGRVDLKKFWGRRMKRLMPAALATLVVTTLLLQRYGQVAEQAAAVDDGPWAQFYLANWHQLSGSSGYWASFELPRVFSHMWSLAIEEQFYMVWPVAVLLCARAGWRNQRLLIGLVVSGCVASVLTMILLYDRADPTRVYMGSDTRAASILVGALFATSAFRRGVAAVHRAIGPGLQWVCVVLAVVLGAGWAVIDGPKSPWLFQGGMFAHSTVAAVLVACCAHTPDEWVSKVLGIAPLRMLGTLSYSLYLLHWPIYVLLNEERTGRSGWSLVALRMAVSLGAAVASKHLVEDPVRFRTGWLRGRAAFGSFVVVMVLGGLFWTVVPDPDTDPAVFDPSTIEVLQTTTTITPPTTLAPATGPVTGPTGSSTTAAPTTTLPRARISRVLFLGDSIAYDQQPAIEAAVRAAGLAFEGRAFPAQGVLSERADSWPEYVDVISSFKPDLVIYQLSVWDLGPVDQQRAAYQRLVELVRGTRSSLLFLGMPPFAVMDPKSTLPQLPAIVEALAAADPGTVRFLPVSGAWGATYAQDLEKDGVPERKPDGVHMCPSGAARIAAWLVEQLAVAYDGVRPAPVRSWVSGPWTTDERFRSPVGICANLR
jgi:peptidoglycan/LPS O-acetylase OafA/YrhL/lysophospholipase L1-like esterase